MASINEHYEHHLGPVYLWMAGGPDVALQTGRAEIEALALPMGPGSSVVDLGAGFGMHAIPIAQTGGCVVAVDSSALMLRTLQELGAGLPIIAVCSDLLDFPGHLRAAPDVVLCMGDTITHLPDAQAVASLVRKAAAALKRGGVFVVSMRDYSHPLRGQQRFIPVRSDERRLLTCFLEYEATSVVVYDILQELTDAGWTTRVSHYRKLRLAPDRLAAEMKASGLEVRIEAGVGGMVRLVASKR
jgi:SAM-dependent methyltransferase